MKKILKQLCLASKVMLGLWIIFSIFFGIGAFCAGDNVLEWIFDLSLLLLLPACINELFKNPTFDLFWNKTSNLSPINFIRGMKFISIFFCSSWIQLNFPLSDVSVFIATGILLLLPAIIIENISNPCLKNYRLKKRIQTVRPNVSPVQLAKGILLIIASLPFLSFLFFLIFALADIGKWEIFEPADILFFAPFSIIGIILLSFGLAFIKGKFIPKSTKRSLTNNNPQTMTTTSPSATIPENDNCEKTYEVSSQDHVTPSAADTSTDKQDINPKLIHSSSIDIEKKRQKWENGGKEKLYEWRTQHHYNTSSDTSTYKQTNTLAQSYDISTIDGMDGHDFEHYCAKLLKKDGFSEVTVTRGSGDQGVDIIAVKDSIKYAIQCKNYATPLSNKPIQEVHAGKSFYNCHVGVVMTNSTFTPSAIQLAIATGVLLWDRSYVQKLMQNLSDKN